MPPRTSPRTLARMKRPLLIALACLSLGGCIFGNSGSGDDTSLQPNPMSTGPSGSGIILIDWTIHGTTPTAMSCTGVDHIELGLTYDDGSSVGIAPIPCTLTRLRYDHLPTGGGTLVLRAVDAGGCDLSVGQSSIDVTPALPSTPVTVALPPISSCK